MKLLSIPFVLCIAILEGSYYHPYLAVGASTTNTTTIISSTHITSTSSPPCSDTLERFFVTEAMIPDKRKSCAWVARKRTNRRCCLSGVADMCPSTCGLCITSMDSTVGMALGAAHTCLMTADGSGVKCMGYNLYGQLGDGSNQESASPVPVSFVGTSCGDTIPLSITAGQFHTCAILRNKSVQCFGDNYDGQLGNGSTGQSNVPVSVNLDAGDIPLSIAAGGAHTCIVLQGNTVKCFGRNEFGQLGIGSTVDSNVPVKVNLDAGDIPLSVAAGYGHTCIMLQGNTVKCFGANDKGQLGNGSNTQSNVPVNVDLDAGDIPLSVVAGGGHTCIVLQGNTVKCFGHNGDGKLGNGSYDNSNVPVNVNLDTDDIPLSVAADTGHTCIMLQSNTVKCFGMNYGGELGNGSIVGNSNVPVKVNLDAGDIPLSVAAGGGHTCIMLQGNTVKCFGSNLNGQLGRGFKSESKSEPQFVIGFGI